MNPSWHAVMKQSSRNISAVSLSCEIFLHTNGSRTGVSSKRGHAAVPISLTGSILVLHVEDDIAPLGVVEFECVLLALVNELVAVLWLSPWQLLLPFKVPPSTWLPDDLDRVNLRLFWDFP